MSDHVMQLTTMEKLDEAIAASTDRPVFVYKHSTVCPVSAQAAGHYHDFADENESAPKPRFTQILVIEHRDISNAVESRLDIRHESPQLLLLREGKVAWHASHFSITDKTIKNALEG